MQNFFANETEAAFRRSEWERAVVAAARVEQTRGRNDRTRWLRLLHVFLARLGSFSLPRIAALVVAEQRHGGESCARSLGSSRATAT